VEYECKNRSADANPSNKQIRGASPERQPLTQEGREQQAAEAENYPIVLVRSGWILYITRTSPGWR
jgi:hypothetical protein